jgi:NADH-quinone oxidoreductase subunit H
MSALIPLWAALVLALGTMLLGLSQGSVPGWFGGVRVAAQALAGAFPALVALLCAAVGAGSFRWSALVASQGAWPHQWTAFSLLNPFQLLAFVVFVVSGMLLMGIAPLDGGLTQADLHGGVASHLNGRRLSLFRLGRFYGFFLWAVIAVVLFLGGWQLPRGILDGLADAGNRPLQLLLEVACVLAKAFALMLVLVGVARVSPRTRVDQITDFAWKVLSPFALLALIGGGVLAALGGAA